MSPSVTHVNPEGMHRSPAFSQAVVVEGSAKTVYIGGQNGVTADGEVAGRDLVAQTEQMFENLETLLAAVGASLRDIVKWTIYVVYGQDVRPGFAIFQRRWGNRGDPPAISVLMVAGLAHPDWLVEIEAIAVIRDDASG